MPLLASSLETDNAFLAILILPIWEDFPWAAASIRGHHNIQTLIRIPAGHMRLVPGHQQDDRDSTTLPPAKWLVELIVISNEAGRQAYLDLVRVHTILAPTIQRVYNISPAQTVFFSATGPTRPAVETAPGSYSHRPLPHCPAHQTPQTTGRLHPPPRPGNQHPTKTTSSLAHVRHFPLPVTPLRVVELCSGLATILEA
jgi:hypothetical protein